MAAERPNPTAMGKIPTKSGAQPRVTGTNKRQEPCKGDIPLPRKCRPFRALVVVGVRDSRGCANLRPALRDYGRLTPGYWHMASSRPYAAKVGFLGRLPVRGRPIGGVQLQAGRL